MEDTMRETVESPRKALEDLEQLGVGQPEPLNRLVRRIAKSIGIYPVPNLAVDVCVRAYTDMLQEQCKDKKQTPEARALAGRIAYCNSLPRLNDSDSIRDFIACVVHGMAINAIPSTEGTKLLYGAQVAQTALPSPKRHKKRNKSAQKASGNHPATPTQSAA